MPQTGIACPECDAKGTTSPLMNGGNGFSCGQGHFFPDSSDLLKGRALRKIDVPKAPRPPREGMVEFKTALPSKLVDALKSKFENKLAGAIECILTAILDPGCFLVTGFDVDRLQTHFGQKVKDSNSLVGLVVNMKSERDEARKEAEANKSAAPATAVPANEINGDFVQVALRIPLGEFIEIKDKAKFNGAAPAAYIQQVISHAIVNKWI